MTLVDNETGDTIINPYITLYGPHRSWAALNTHTFGEACQALLLSIHDERKIMEFAKEKRDLYKVVATIGKQNHMLESQSRYPSFWRSVRTEGADDAIAMIPLGYLTEDIIKEKFPKSYEYFKKREERTT